MSDTDGAAGNQIGNQGGQGGSFRIMTQYVKDLSFESPNAPHSLGSGLPQPAIDIIIDVVPRKLGQEQYEVALHMTAKATRGENVVFIAELMYAGLFAISGIGEEHMEGLLMIEAPRHLFPFARRVMADATRDGGFPPLALDYMDFERIYRQRLAQRQAEAAGAPAAGEAAPAGDEA